MSVMSLSWLGPIAATIDGRPVTFRTRKAQALLIYLTTESALQGDAPTRRETLLGLLWPDYPERSARQSLRTNLSYLKRGLSAPAEGESKTSFILSDSQKVKVNPAALYKLDVATFNQRLEECAHHEHESAVACAECQERLEWAAELYRGEFLADFYLPDSSQFEAWVSARREAFRRQMLDALEALTAGRLAAEEFEAAEGYARRQLEIDPLRESAHRQLMEALARQGRRRAALAHFEEFELALRDELGIEPSAETQSLVEAIKAGDMEGNVHVHPVVRVEEAASETFEKKAPDEPTPVTTSRRQVAHNLPPQSTPFIGREQELAELAQLIADPEVRLVTIIGPGGMGKTRLALAAAERLVNETREDALFTDGVYFLPLAPLQSRYDMVLEIGNRVGLQFRGNQEPEQQLLDYLRSDRTLLILDNFEHLMAGADLVATIRQRAGNVTIAVTSRERLNLSGEAVFRLDGLTYPADVRPGDDLVDVGAYGAVSLFLHHARLLQPRLQFDERSMSQVIKICRLVGGMPLALVLAAGWVELLALDELADAISGNLDLLRSQQRDLPERQRSVRAVVDTSWQRLSQAERTVFMKLAIFRGGFTREAAEQVAGADLFLLRSLMEKSLIAPVGKDRYQLHELLRQFGDERLVENEMLDEARAAHGHYYLKLVGELEADIKGRDQIGALRAIGADLENIRRAWRWGLEQGHLAPIGGGLETLSHYFLISSRAEEGHAMFVQARERFEQEGEEPLLGRLLAHHAWLRSEFALAPHTIEADLRRSMEMAKRQSDPKEVALVRLAQGWYYVRIETDYPAALAEFEAAIETFRAVNDRYYVAMLLHRIGYCNRNELEVMISSTRQSLSMALEIGSHFDASWAQSNLGGFARWSGDVETAAEEIRMALDMHERLGLPVQAHYLQSHLALIGFLLGDLDQMVSYMPAQQDPGQGKPNEVHRAAFLTRRALHAVVQGRTELAIRYGLRSLDLAGNEEAIHDAHWALAMATVDKDALDEAQQHLLAAFRVPILPLSPGLMTRSLPVMAVLLHRRGRSRRAAQILSLVQNHPASLTGWTQLWPATAGLRAELERTLGREAFLDAWEEGKSLDLVETVTQLTAELSGGVDA